MDPRLAQSVIQAVDSRAEQLDKQRPYTAYGTVASVDVANHKVSVYVAGDTTASSGFSYHRELRPLVGNRVRVVIDPRGDRYVEEIYGSDIIWQVHGHHTITDTGDLAVITTPSRIPGLILTQQTLSGHAEVWVVKAWTQIRAIANAQESFNLYCYFDGVQQAETPQLTMENETDHRQQLGFTWRINVAAGEHAVEIKIARGGASGSYFVDGSNRMEVWRLG